MKDLKRYSIIVSVLLIVYLTAQFNRPKTTDWTETLIDSDKIPYGTQVIYQRIKDIFPNVGVITLREPVYNVLNDHSTKYGSYIIICESINLNENDYKELVKFIKRGNDVFIAASYFGEQFLKNYKISTQSELNSTGLTFRNKFLDTNRVYRFEKEISNQYFNSFDTAKTTVISNNTAGHSTYIRCQIGKGSLFLNSNPLMFSNYSLLNKNGADYAAIALSYIKSNNLLIWDEFYTKGRLGEHNTMRVFFQYINLKWAFYISLLSLIIFVLYEMKRRQRIIPVIEPLANSTLGFVNVVGQVYYEQRNNANICSKKILYFLEHLRTKYYLKTNPLDLEFINNLSQKTGISHAFISELINHIRYVSAQQRVSDHELILLNQLIENFYSQSA